MIVNAGSVQDIKASLDHAYEKLSVKDLEAEVAYEKATRNRKTVIRIMEGKLRKKQREMAKGGIFLTRQIEFEDHGQDFLTWRIDRLGRVVDCQPFQASVWVGGYVLNHEALALGGQVVYMHRRMDAPIAIKYPILQMENKEVAS